ncbi:hypothetical protein DSM112329_03020 [Paraconexibacter sp. AEG42_29]|uniref:Serine acetyltransferase n=1 Tax=Paraconexibacter sp. AEG42_29 TaxID=2997339 RepID=A0AAU7AWT4_9ACTN
MTNHPDAPEPETLGLLQLIWSDYEHHVAWRGDERRSALLRAPIRLLTNTSLRACVLVRLTCASPRWMHWFWRSVLVALHSSEVVYGAKIGPGLCLPHPFGIGVGGDVAIGRNVTLSQNVTMGSDRRHAGEPQLGDDVVVLPGAMLAGPIRIGHGAVIGANTVVTEDVPDGGMAAAPRTRIVARQVKWDV